MTKPNGGIAAIFAALLLAVLTAAPGNSAAIERRSDGGVIALDISDGPDAGSSVELTFDEPVAPAALEREIEQIYGPVTLSVTADGEATAVPQTPRRRAAPVTSARTNFGTSYINCDSFHRAADSNVIYTVQRPCGSQRAPWSLRLAPTMQAFCVAPVQELGMQYVTDGGPLAVNASHSVPCNYTLHGTFFGVGVGKSTNWYDQVAFRHTIGPGGNALIEVYGTHRWLSKA
jgi:hypothetical protein